MGSLNIPVIYSSNQATTGYSIKAESFLENVDAFARKRVSQPLTIFDSKQIIDKQPLFWDEATRSGAGTSSTHSKDRASTQLSVTPGVDGNITRQTKRWFIYQPGKSQLVKMTGVINSSADNLSLVIRSNVTGTPVETIIPRTEWNLDKLDGTGPSGVILDPYMSQIFFFDFEWLGVGTVAYGFFIDRQPVYVHFEHNANTKDTVYMSSPNLPLRYEITSDSGVITKRMGLMNDDNGIFLMAQGTENISPVLEQICSTVITEGGRQDTGVGRSVNRATTPLTTLADNAIYPLIGLRLKPGELSSLIKPLSSSIMCTSAATYVIYLKLNPSVVGVAPTWLTLPNSSVEYCLPVNTTTVTGGTDTYSDISQDTQQNVGGVRFSQATDLSLGSTIDGTPDEVYICVQVLIGTSETFYAGLNFSETI